MKNIILILLLLFAVDSMAQVPYPLIKEIRALLNEGEYDKGIIKCDEALSLYPEESDLYCFKALFLRGADYEVKFENDMVLFKEVNTCLLKSLKIDSSHWWTTELLADLYYDYQSWDTALYYLENLLELSNRNDERLHAYINLAATKSQMKDTTGAIETAKRVIELAPNKVYSYVRLSSIYLGFEYYKKAELILKRALRYFPESRPVLTNLGFVCLITEQYEKSIEYYDRAEEVDPKEFSIYSNRGYCYLMLGDYKKAKKEIKKSLKLNPENPYAYKYRAIYLIKTEGSQEDICADLDMALSLGYSVYDDEVEILKAKHCK